MQSSDLFLASSIPQKAQDLANFTTRDSEPDAQAPLACNELCEPESLQILLSQSFYLESFPIQLDPISPRRGSFIEEFDQIIGTPEIDTQNVPSQKNSTKSQKQIDTPEDSSLSQMKVDQQEDVIKACISATSPVPKLKISLDNIFETPNLKKNQNLPKYVYGLLEKNLSKFKKEKYFQNHEAFYLRFKQTLKNSHKNKHSLNTLKWILHDNIEDEYEQKLARLVLRKTLNQKLRSSIIPTRQEKNKMEYLVGTKVYSLRCCHPTLLSRAEYR